MPPANVKAAASVVFQQPHGEQAARVVAVNGNLVVEYAHGRDAMGVECLSDGCVRDALRDAVLLAYAESTRDPDVLLTIVRYLTKATTVRYLTKATTAACRSSRSRKILAIAPATQSARPLLRNTSRQDASGEYTGRTSQPSGRSMCQLFTTWEGEGGAAFGSEV